MHWQEDVLAVGRALRAWPLPLLVDLDHRHPQQVWNDAGLLGGMQQGEYRSVHLSRCWEALGLPGEAADWDDAKILLHFGMQQQKVVAFAGGLHARLGVHSLVSNLDELAFAMIADEVLGGWSLLREWRLAETRLSA